MTSLTREQAGEQAQAAFPGADLYVFDTDAGAVVLRMPDAATVQKHEDDLARPGASPRSAANALALKCAAVPDAAGLQGILTQYPMLAMIRLVPTLLDGATGLNAPDDGQVSEFRFGAGEPPEEAPAWLAPVQAELVAANPKLKLHAIRTDQGAVVLKPAQPAALDRYYASTGRKQQAYQTLVADCLAYPTREIIADYFVKRPRLALMLADRIMENATGQARANASKL